MKKATNTRWTRTVAPGTVASRTAVAAVALLVVAGCSSSGSRAGRATPAPPPPGVVSSAQVRQPAEIRSLDVDPEGRLLELVADRPLVWTSFRDARGDLVIELPNSMPSTGVEDLSPAAGLVSGVDVELLDDADRPLTRLTVRTREPSEHSLTGDDATLRIELLPVSGETAVALAYEPVPAEEPREETLLAATPPPVEEEVPAEPGQAAPRPRATSEPAAPLATWGTAESPQRGPQPTGVAASQLYSVDVLSAGTDTVIQVAGDGEFDYSTFRLESPERFVVDLVGVVNNSPRSLVPVDSNYVDQVRVGQFKPRPEPVSRVVFDLHGFVPPSIERNADGLVVRFAASPTLAEDVRETASAGGAPSAPAGATVPELAPPVLVEAEVYDDAVGEPEPAAPQPAATPEPVIAGRPGPEQGAAAPPAVPIYQPSEQAAKPEAPPALTVAQRRETSDVTAFEAQELPPETPEEEVDPVLQSFGALVVSRREPEYVGEPIDMSLRQADLVETLRSFANISDLNFVIQPGVTGTVTVELKGVPWDQAMTQILKINNLGVDIEGTIVRIAPLAQLRAEAEEQRRLQQARQQSVPLRTVLKSLSYSNANEVAALLRNRRGSLLTARGTVQIDQRTNTLIIQELPDNIDTLLAVIENLDAPEPQVIIEARIVEATKSFSRTLGIEWGYDFVADQANGNTTGLQFPNNVDTDGRIALLTGGANGFINMRLGSILNTFNLDARLQVAENEGLVNLVSAPRVTTLNNNAASIQSGVQLPIQTVSNRTVSVQFVNATLQLQVTPQVTAEGTIVLDINVAKRSPAPGLAIVGSTNAPIQTREARTKVIVRDGGTTVIGGIYEVTANNVQDRVPGLSNIPILGNLFKNRNRQNSNDELMIFITPRIVQM